MAQLDRFLGDIEPEVLEIEGNSLEGVLADYFDRKPPFGKEKNKSEFPDALVLDTLRRWCQDKGEDMAVVSADVGMASGCLPGGPLYCFPSIEAYLNSVLAGADALRFFISDRVNERIDQVLRDLDREFSNLGFGLVDQVDGEVESATLLSVEFCDSVEVIALSEKTASVEMPAWLEFRADIRYVEEGSGFYDSEEGKMLFENEIADSVQHRVFRSIGLDIQYEALAADRFKIERVWFADAADIEIESYPGRDWR